MDENQYIALESFFDLIGNIFPFGNFIESKETKIMKFRDMLSEPDELFGKNPEPSKYNHILGSLVKVDDKAGVISIKGINFSLLFYRVTEVYGEKSLKQIFYKTYLPKDIDKFNKKRITRSNMRATSIIIPIFFALELSIIFSDLYAKYKTPAYKTIAKSIYEKTWLSKADNSKPEPINISRATRTLNPGYALKPHQLDFISAYPVWKARLNLRGCYLAFDQGLGKTLTAMSLALALGTQKIYVVCPNSLVNNWYAEINSYYSGRIKACICKNNSDPPKDAAVFIVNNESIKKIYPYIDRRVKTMLIIDEGHNFRDLNSMRAKELIALREKLRPNDVLPMSGTPLKARPNEIVPIMMLLDPLFTETAASIYNKCFNFDNYTGSQIVTKRLGMFIYRKMKSDVLTLPDKIIEDLEVTISNPEPYFISSISTAVKVLYNTYYDEVIGENKYMIEEFHNLVNRYSITTPANNAWYLRRITKAANTEDTFSISNEHEIDVDRVTTFLDKYVIANENFPPKQIKRIKQLESQLLHYDRVAMGRALGKVYPPRRTQMYNTMWDENEKMFIEKIESNVKKTVIFSQFLGVVKHIEERLTANGIGCVVISGAQNTTDRSNKIQRFRVDDNTRVLIATSQTLSTGVTLIEASQMFFFGPPWRSTDFDQCCDRIYRIGQDVDVHIYVVVMRTDKLNLSSRMENILKWSNDMFHGALDETIVKD